jgi:hypothetical protein
LKGGEYHGGNKKGSCKEGSGKINCQEGHKEEIRTE